MEFGPEDSFSDKKKRMAFHLKQTHYHDNAATEAEV